MLERSALKRLGRGLILPTALLCLASAPLAAADGFGLEVRDTATGTPSLPYPLMIDEQSPLSFDLGGSETRKLQLQLEQPLSLKTVSSARLQDGGAGLIGLDATLDLPVADHLSLTAGAGRQLGASHFQALGSVHCMNGILRPDSYTASGCRFVTGPMASMESNQFRLGARLDFGNASASVNWFTQGSGLDNPAVQDVNRSMGQTVMSRGLLSPEMVSPLVSEGDDPLQFMNAGTSGVDLNFKVGITTDAKGDIQLGLAFTRVLEADYQGLYAQGPEAFRWTLAQPYNMAKMNLEWSRGSISGGVQGFYRDSVDFLNRDNLDSLTTFDVHFTWRTPWNANLSVGASNVLNAGADTAPATDNQPVDPFESIYGRIPYVRYKQDL
jgi:hypothetical protein